MTSCKIYIIYKKFTESKKAIYYLNVPNTSFNIGLGRNN